MIGLSAQVLPEDLPVVLKLVPSSLRTPSLPLISVPKPKTASARPGARLRNGSGTGRSRFCPQTREGLTTCWCSRNPWACADGLHHDGTAATVARLHRVPDAAAEAMEGFGVATARAVGVPVLEIRSISIRSVRGTAVHGRSRRRRRLRPQVHYYRRCYDENRFFPLPQRHICISCLGSRTDSRRPKLDVSYADIDITNHWAAEDREHDILKYPMPRAWVLDEYALLPCGGALGRGCGPLVLTADKLTDGKTPDSPADLSGRRVAVPSERSTAYLLFRLWAAQNVPGGLGEIVVMPFDQIMPAVRDGAIDAGLVIHEARFTYSSYGLKMMTDLGWWESDTNLPIPLGAIVARRSLDLASISNWIRSSVEYAWKHPEESRPMSSITLRKWTRMSPMLTSTFTSIHLPRSWARTAMPRFQPC